MSSSEIEFIQTIDDLSIAAPNQASFMTTFVLHEQHDWFEDEIKFLRTYIKPGMNIIDIGANYGVYTLSMAKHISPNGKLWAFEPTPETASYLNHSIKENKLQNVTLIEAALSNKTGIARLYLNKNSELNSLDGDLSSSDESASVKLLTLDSCNDKYKWKGIDFIKLDAEGEESNILKKAKSVLKNHSPLVMYELKHGNNVNTSLINRFKQMGYSSYRLIPGLNCLVPFDSSVPHDNYLLNLFACNQQKAALLKSEEILVDNINPQLYDDVKYASRYISQFPYAATIDIENNNKTYQTIVSSYLFSLHGNATIAHRLSCLLGAIEQINIDVEKTQDLAVLATYARIYYAAGERKKGNELLKKIITSAAQPSKIALSHMCLAAHARYDSIDPGDNLQNWYMAAIIEKYIEKHAFSCYFTGKKLLPLFEKLRSLGFMSADMQCRENLIRTAF